MEVYFSSGKITDSWLNNLSRNRLAELAYKCVVDSEYWGDITDTIDWDGTPDVCVCVELSTLEGYIQKRPHLLSEEELIKCGFKETVGWGLTFNRETHQWERVTFATWELKDDE